MTGNWRNSQNVRRRILMKFNYKRKLNRESRKNASNVPGSYLHKRSNRMNKQKPLLLRVASSGYSERPRRFHARVDFRATLSPLTDESIPKLHHYGYGSFHARSCLLFKDAFFYRPYLFNDEKCDILRNKNRERLNAEARLARGLFLKSSGECAIYMGNSMHARNTLHNDDSTSRSYEPTSRSHISSLSTTPRKDEEY